MPLKALKDGIEIQSWDMSPDEWINLKASAKQHDLRMTCCDRKAILRTSKLGTQHFAHARRGECTSAPETADHILLKSIAAQCAKKAGWTVTTERPGSTPSGEEWIADVFCEKGDLKVAIEIQWSQQSEEEFLRRQKRYDESGVRCAWLYRATKNRFYDLRGPLYSEDLPVFYFRKEYGLASYSIPQFEVDLEEFLTALMTGGVKWEPKEKSQVTAIFYGVRHQCFACNKHSTPFTNVVFQTDKGQTYCCGSVANRDILEWVNYGGYLQHLFGKQLGIISRRRHNIHGKGDGFWLCNSCPHCNVYFRNYWISKHGDSHHFLPTSNQIGRSWQQRNFHRTGHQELARQQFIMAELPPVFRKSPHWYLRGKKSEVSISPGWPPNQNET